MVSCTLCLSMPLMLFFGTPVERRKDAIPCMVAACCQHPAPSALRSPLSVLRAPCFLASLLSGFAGLFCDLSVQLLAL